MRQSRIIGTSIASFAIVGIFIGVPPASAQNKEARGTATNVSDSSLTVKVGAQEMKFAVDSTTVIEKKAAARATRDATNNNGTPAPTLTSYIKTGQPVLVVYREASGANQAVSIRPIADAGSGGGSTSDQGARNATGRVKTVASNAVTIESGGKDLTFAVTGATHFAGKGFGTASKKAGDRLYITELIGAGDRVAVTYTDANGTLNASDVRLLNKAE